MKNYFAGVQNFGSAPRKGITAVVAIVLLLMMTVGAAGLAYVWITKLQSDVMTTTSASTEQVTNQQSGRIAIDSMWNASGVLTFNLKNTGTYAFQDIHNFRYYVNGKPVSGTVTYNPNANAFPSKDVRQVSIAQTDALFPYVGSPVDVLVTTDLDGVQVNYRCSISSNTTTYC